jgi:hypothetical protein
MKVFSLQDGIDREGFFRGSEEAPKVIEMIKKGQYPLIADVKKAGKTTLKQEIADLLDGQSVDTIRGESEKRVVAVTLGWGLEMHGQVILLHQDLKFKLEHLQQGSPCLTLFQMLRKI